MCIWNILGNKGLDTSEMHLVECNDPFPYGRTIRVYKYMAFLGLAANSFGIVVLYVEKFGDMLDCLYTLLKSQFNK